VKPCAIYSGLNFGSHLSRLNYGSGIQPRGESAVNSALIFLLAGSVISVDGSFLFIFVSIFVLIYLLNHTLFAPINRILDERERLGLGRMGEAKRLLASYEERLKNYEAQLQAVRAEAYQTLEAQRKEAQSARQSLLAEVKQETAQQIAAAKDDIARQTTAAQQNLEAEARAMASTITSQLLKR
jgi:F-type H+-transporting ATPase subunit b